MAPFPPIHHTQFQNPLGNLTAGYLLLWLFLAFKLGVEFSFYQTIYRPTIPDKNVETKCNFFNSLLYFAPVNSNPPSPKQCWICSFIIFASNYAFNIEVGKGGEGEAIFHRKEKT